MPDRRFVLIALCAALPLGGSSSELYVASDSLPALRDHPLHRYFSVPPTRASRRCRAETVTGRMGLVPLGDRFLVKAGTHTVSPRLEPDTRLRSRVVDGVPRIHRGDRVTVSSLVCPGRTVEIARQLRVG